MWTISSLISFIRLSLFNVKNTLHFYCYTLSESWILFIPTTLPPPFSWTTTCQEWAAAIKVHSHKLNICLNTYTHTHTFSLWKHIVHWESCLVIASSIWEVSMEINISHHFPFWKIYNLCVIVFVVKGYSWICGYHLDSKWSWLKEMLSKIQSVISF